MRFADVAWHGAIFGDPTPRGRIEKAAGRHRFSGFVIAHEMRSAAEDHRRFPFAGVPHLLLAKARVCKMRFSSQRPVGCKEQEQVAALPMALARLEHGLLSWHVIATVAVDEDQAAKAVLDEILQQTV